MRHYRLDMIVTVMIGVILAWFFGISVVPLFLLLVVVEIALSGDNATVNVKLLSLMSPLGVRLFMTLGILIAAGFMRFLFPILMVTFTGDQSFGATLHMAVTDIDQYAAHVHAIEAVLAVFGGIYLLNIALDFFTGDNDDCDGHWFGPLERPLAWVGAKFPKVAIIVAIIAVLLVGFNAEASQRYTVIVAGMISLGAYMVISSLAEWAENMTNDYADKHATKAGVVKAGFFVNLVLFVALEAQDAAFSFDGVAGALAITKEPLVIAAGLGVGALFVRSATKHLMESNSLAEFRYLGHGAYYAILVLAISQLISPFVVVPGYGYYVGIISVALIVGATVHSHILNSKEDTDESIVDEIAGVDIEPDQNGASAPARMS